MWTNLSPPWSPLDGLAMVYDSAVHRILLLGPNWSAPGFDIWAYDFLNNTWTDRMTICPYYIQLGFQAAYDARADKTIVFSGFVPRVRPLNETLAYDYASNTWTDRHPAVSPPGPAAGLHSMVYDAAADRIVLYGVSFHETWTYAYDTNIWTDMSPRQPPSVVSPSLAYDAHADRVILYGGVLNASNTLSNETWNYDLNTNTWTNVSVSPHPAGTIGVNPALAYDSVAQRTLLWLPSVTWAYDTGSQTWTDLQPSTEPSSNNSYLMVYDATAGRTILWLDRFLAPLRTHVSETWAYASAPAAAPTSERVLAGAIVVAAVIAAVVIVFWVRRRGQKQPPG